MSPIMPYDIYKSICEKFDTEFTTVDSKPTSALYHRGSANGYYLITVHTYAEGSVIGTWDIQWFDEEGPWDVANGFIYNNTVPSEFVDKIIRMVNLYKEDTHK